MQQAPHHALQAAALCVSSINSTLLRLSASPTGSTFTVACNSRLPFPQLIGYILNPLPATQTTVSALDAVSSFAMCWELPRQNDGYSESKGRRSNERHKADKQEACNLPWQISVYLSSHPADEDLF